jgi:hypothetical protein
MRLHRHEKAATKCQPYAVRKASVCELVRRRAVVFEAFVAALKTQTKIAVTKENAVSLATSRVSTAPGLLTTG